MYKSLPTNQKTFDLDVIGETSNEQHKGQFVCKCVLNIAERHEMELEKTRLSADYSNPSPGLAGIAAALATIRVKIISGPAWWVDSDRGAKLLDENVLLALFDAVNEKEQEWRDELNKRATVAKEKNTAREAKKEAKKETPEE